MDDKTCVSLIKYPLQDACLYSGEMGRERVHPLCQLLHFLLLIALQSQSFILIGMLCFCCAKTISFYLPPGSPAGDYNLHHVCASMRASVCAWVTQISLKLLQLHIFGKLLVLMNFYALQIFFGLVNFGLLLSE